ncbi:MAG: HAMP domain-containing sensor histidine kinase [Cyanobacteria bacterium P01_A01_bin.3]
MGQPIVREISAGDLCAESTLKRSIPTSSTASATNRDNSLSNASGTRDQDWELAFWRSEMLRRFKTDLLGNLGHELRSPLSSQLGSLDLVLSGLCESEAEVQEFIGAARQSAQNHLQLIVDCIALSRYESPVLPLDSRPTSLTPVLAQVERLLSPIATDRGLRLEWSPGDIEVFADPHGCEQVVLGVGMWSLGQLIHGSLRVTVGGTAKAGSSGAGDDPNQGLVAEDANVGGYVILTATGQLRQDSSEREVLYWDVPRMMVEAMGGRLLRSRDGDRQHTLMVQFPVKPA